MLITHQFISELRYLPTNYLKIAMSFDFGTEKISIRKTEQKTLNIYWKSAGRILSNYIDAVATEVTNWKKNE